MDVGPAVALGAIGLVAAVVNGAIGYGFSSITVPVALLFLASRVLNPALVLVELAVNAYVLIVNRASLPMVRVTPLAIGVVPGVILGSAILGSADPDAIKIATYVVLLPLVLSQAAGFRRRSATLEGGLALPIGAGVGLLYAITTISGPPLALILNNQGYSKQEFRAAIASVRLIESVATTIAYLQLGLFTTSSTALVLPLAVAVVVGLPLGTLVIRAVDAELFRRLSMSFGALVVGLGLSRSVDRLDVVPTPSAYAIVGAVSIVALWLLRRFFARRDRDRLQAPEVRPG